MNTLKTQSIPKERKLEMEVLNLKLHIAKANVQTLENDFKKMVAQTFTEASLKPENWVIDLDRGLFVERT